MLHDFYFIQENVAPPNVRWMTINQWELKYVYTGYDLLSHFIDHNYNVMVF